MSSENSDWVRNFTTRLESVGWRVEKSGTSHNKVFDGSGKLLLTFASTPGGGNRGMMNALAQAKRAGLFQLETQVKLQREKDRLQRLEDDRAANDAKLAGIAVQSRAQDDEVDTNIPDLGSVNGVRVVVVAPAMIKTPVMKKAGPLVDGTEVMLADDTVLYRCEKPAATGTKPDLEGICHRTFESVTSLKVHMSSHKLKVDQAAAPTKLEDFVPTAEPKTSPNGVSPATKISNRLNEAFDSIGLLMKGMDAVRVELTEIRGELSKLEVADPETLKKAAQFDNLKAMLS